MELEFAGRLRVCIVALFWKKKSNQERSGSLLALCDECIVPCTFDKYSFRGCSRPAAVQLQSTTESEDTGVRQQSGLIGSGAPHLLFPTGDGLRVKVQVRGPRHSVWRKICGNLIFITIHLLIYTTVPSVYLVAFLCFYFETLLPKL